MLGSGAGLSISGRKGKPTLYLEEHESLLFLGQKESSVINLPQVAGWLLQASALVSDADRSDTGHDRGWTSLGYREPMLMGSCVASTLPSWLLHS